MSEFAHQRAELVAQLRRRGIVDERVLSAMATVPREQFVPDALQHEAYKDAALPVTEGQTISQPFIVALMTQLLSLEGGETVLEIGTGTGYQTAVLSLLCRFVVSIERLSGLAAEAKNRLSQLGYGNVELHTGDGTLGWKPAAPYDRVLVTAGAPEVPAPLYNQLRLGGRLVIPVGDEQSQVLEVIVKGQHGPEVIDAGGCRFVKLIGDAGWEPV
ncbi:MAG: protein-L-isoaspartate(D-aspartate) O-methyltransferase [Planctomycetaceae bacterium]|nr:protein-L-isoaspartate(D-aspartate) O-methyltransferase [Planctomycetaceae bacterium]